MGGEGRSFLGVMVGGRGPGCLTEPVFYVRVGVSGAELGYTSGWLCASMCRGRVCVCIWCAWVQVLCVSA